MEYVNIYEAKTNLSRLIKQAEQGEEIVIQRDGKPVVKLVAIKSEVSPRQPGMWAGHVQVTPGAFEPLSEEEAALFEGEG